MEEFIEALRNGKGYDWICNHGHELSKTELCDIVKEFDFTIYEQCGMNKNDAQEFYNGEADNLEEIYFN